VSILREDTGFVVCFLSAAQTAEDVFTIYVTGG